MKVAVICLFLISILPLFLYLVDGYYKKDMDRAIKQIVAFILTTICFSILYFIWGWYYALFTPLFLIVFILIFRKGNDK